MKIVIIIPYFYPSVGGLQNYALQIARGLQDAGHTVCIITSNHEGKKYKNEKIFGLTVYRLPISITISNTPINITWFSQIRSIIRKEKPDVINAHTPVPFIADIAAIIAKKEKIPFVLTYQNDLIKDSVILNSIIKAYYFFLGIPTLEKANKIIASSHHYVNSSNYLRHRKEKTEIVSPGVTLENFDRNTLSATKFKKLQDEFRNKKIVLFVGQLDKTHEHKGLHYLIESLSLAKESDNTVHLIVVGKGNNIEFYKNLVNQFSLQNSVTFAGFVPDSELPYFYNLSDVIVLPSYNVSEGFGMVLIEAGASNKPVIGSRIGGIPFVIKENETGFLVEPKNSRELANVMLQLFSNSLLARDMGEANYKLVKNNFTWDKQIEKTEKIFKSLLV